MANIVITYCLNLQYRNLPSFTSIYMPCVVPSRHDTPSSGRLFSSSFEVPASHSTRATSGQNPVGPWARVSLSVTLWDAEGSPSFATLCMLSSNSTCCIEKSQGKKRTSSASAVAFNCHTAAHDLRVIRPALLDSHFLHLFTFYLFFCKDLFHRM